MRPTDEILQEGIRAGQIGGSVEPHGDHAMGFFAFLGEDRAITGHGVDLGSGVGIPGLILAEAYSNTSWTLVERREGRTDLLRRAIRRLGFDDRVEVFTGDATDAARTALRGSADWVTARSFGPPADTAECATGFLKPGGSLIASESFDADVVARWPPESLEHNVGLKWHSEWETTAGRYVRVIRTSEEFTNLPRRGARKQPLF